MTESQIWREVDRILSKQSSLRFDLSRSRNASELIWQAIFYTEKDHVVIARSCAGERLSALEEVVEKYRERGK